MKISELSSCWKEVYRISLERFEFVEAAKLATYYKPPYLYKYFSFDEFWEDNIFNGSICLNTARNFNDPLDAKWFIDYESVIRARYEKEGISWTESGISEEFMQNNVQLYEEDLIYLQNLFRIACFSETPYSNLMWGHYAQKHQGFCLEYNTNKISLDLGILMPVLYTEKPYNASMLFDKEDAYIYDCGCPVVFKSNDWKYEKEWRLLERNFSREDNPKIVSIKDSITGIYLGLNFVRRLGLDEMKKLEIWAAENKIEIYLMEKSYKSYDLVADTLKDVRSSRNKGIIG